MSPLEINIPTHVAEVARALVKNKYLVDKAVAECGAVMLAGDLHDQGYGPAEPWPFIDRVLPFIYTSEALGERFRALVPTAHTLGCSWRWRARSLDGELALRLEKHLSDGDAYDRGGVNAASYFWVEPLGLIAPIEGKNRVDFLRERGFEFIPAHVTAKSYPEPHRLKLYHVTRNRVRHLWIVLDSRWLQRIDHPSWTLPLLEAYGVETCPWPHEFPNETAVQLAFFEPAWGVEFSNPRTLDNDIIDLHAVAEKSEQGDERVVASLIDLDGVTVDPRVWIASIAGAIGSMAALGWTPENWIQARLTAATVFGGAIVLGVFPLLRRLVVRSGALKN